MSEIIAEQEIERQRGLGKSKLFKRLGWFAGLAAVTAVARSDQEIINKWVDGSMSHPFIGYVGALAAIIITGNKIGKSPAVQAKTAATGAFLVNLLVEVGQDVLNIGDSRVYSFLHESQLPETTKDLAFAGLGLGVYLFSERKSMTNKVSGTAGLE